MDINAIKTHKEWNETHERGISMIDCTYFSQITKPQHYPIQNKNRNQNG